MIFVGSKGCLGTSGSGEGAHAGDWIRACKGGAPATYYEGKLPANAKGEITNNRDANRWVKPRFRKGWELKL